MSSSRLTWSAALLSWIIAVPLWYVSRYVLVIAHEGGHALLAKLLFRKLASITFNRSGGGATAPKPPVPLLFNVFIGLGGYLGPSIFGLFGAWMLLDGRSETVLWASLGFLVVMLLAVRGVMGFLLVPALFVIIYLLLTKVGQPQQTLFTHMWVWFLLIGSVQRMLLFVQDKQYDDTGTDPMILQGMTSVPSAIWTFLMLVGSIAALVYGGALLLRQG